MNHEIRWDCHMHSSFSADSDTPMEEMIQKASQLGLSGICFTEHLDPDYPDTPDGLAFALDIPAYREKLSALSRKWAQKPEVLYGIEYGLQPHLAESFRRLVREEDFDFVIGSSHAVHGYDPYYPQFFQNRKESRCYMEYFESILENLPYYDDIDVYGHLDYIVRYGPSRNRYYSYGRYKNILDEILRTLRKKNIGLELNTGGYKSGLEQPNPCPAILRRYREMGGEIVTVGADAHSPEFIGHEFEKAAEILRECGFRYYTVFRKRKPEFYRL
ncbi:MAG: histidinol-phosphatase HisJ family protein [Clostridiales bacterium]|nr:histidinol-phosphatase HisJ family protein [Clostridiales bacterium]